MNQVTLIGRLTADPVLNTTSGGTNVCKFTLAVDRPYKDSKGEKQADYLNVVVWRELGNNCAKYLTKGRQCALRGSVQTRSFIKDDEKRYITEIVAEQVEFLGSKAESTEPKQTRPKLEDLQVIEDDDLPF